MVVPRQGTANRCRRPTLPPTANGGGWRARTRLIAESHGTRVSASCDRASRGSSSWPTAATTAREATVISVPRAWSRPPGVAQGVEVEPRQMAQAAVDRLEAVPGAAAAEVAGLDEGDGKAPRGRFPRGGGADDASAQDQDVEVTALERPDVPLHAGSA